MRLIARPSAPGARSAGAAAGARCGGMAGAVLPQPVARAFPEQHIPLNAVSVYVQEMGAAHPVVLAPALAADEPGVDDEAGDDVRRPRSSSGPTTAGRPKRMPTDRSSAACWRAIWCSKATAIRKSPSSNSRSSSRGCARPGSRRSAATWSSIGPSSTPEPYDPGAFDCRAAASLQRRPRRAAGQLQERALRLRAESRRRRGRGSRRAARWPTSRCTARRGWSTATAATGKAGWSPHSTPATTAPT